MTPGTEDFAASRARRHEARMPEEDWAALKARALAVGAITDDLGPPAWPIGVRRETLRERLAEMGVIAAKAT